MISILLVLLFLETSFCDFSTYTNSILKFKKTFFLNSGINVRDRLMENIGFLEISRCKSRNSGIFGTEAFKSKVLTIRF